VKTTARDGVLLTVAVVRSRPAPFPWQLISAPGFEGSSSVHAHAN